MNSYFSGKTIWITGASSGIGEQMAYQLAAMDAHLIISARKKDDLERVRMHCAMPENVVVQVLDQASEESVKAATEAVFKKFQRLDILFNNGGTSQRAETMETSMEVVRRIFEVNFFGNILLSKLVAERMIAQKDGHIVVTSSLLGKWGFYLRSTYAATKHALHGYYDSMRMEIEKKGVQITLVTPGLIATDISKHALNGTGEPTNQMDANQAGGMSAEECAQKILSGVSRGKNEFGVGGRETFGLVVKRFFPKMFERVLRRRAAR